MENCAIRRLSGQQSNLLPMFTAFRQGHTRHSYDPPHFGRIMPLLMDVPGHQGIEIHWGNYPDNSRGCILVGMSQSMDGDKPAIWNTRAAFDSLFPEIEGAQAEGCTISVIDD